MVKRDDTSGNRHYILPVCNMTCLNLYYFLRYPQRQKRLILGRLVESRTPLEEFNVFFNVCS